MNGAKLVVTPYQISGHEKAILGRLSSAGFDIVANELDRYWTRDELIARVAGADAIIASSGRYDPELLERCPNLKLIIKFGVGYDNIDVGYCASRSIAVAATFGANHHAVADYAMALMLCAATGLIESSSELRQGIWRTRVHRDLHGATLGILGLGRIGAEIARRASGFDMRVLYWDIARMADKEARLGVQFSTLDNLAREADFISLNLPRTPQTANLIDAAFLRKMKSTATLVNTARGGIVDEVALLAALRDGTIRFAASDVFATEPAAGHPLLELPNFVGTPHTSAVSVGSVRAMSQLCADMAIQFFELGTVPAEYAVTQS